VNHPHTLYAPLEVYEVTVYEVHDPNKAQNVATFTNRGEAEAYAATINSYAGLTTPATIKEDNNNG